MDTTETPRVADEKAQLRAEELQKEGVFTMCLCNSESVNKGRHDGYPPQEIGCTDIFFLILFVLFCFVMLLISVFAYIYGNPHRLTSGMDSFGNVCGTTNQPIENFTLSGMDMTNKPFVYFFDQKNLDRATKICVETCPTEELLTGADLLDFYKKTNFSLCRYDYLLDSETVASVNNDGFKFKLLESRKDQTANPYCPSLPHTPSLPILRRCVPRPKKSVGKIMAYQAYAYLNGLGIFKKILGDVATTWTSVLAMTSLSFGISLALVLMMHSITALMSKFIMIGTSAFCILLTAYLWVVYAQIKFGLETQEFTETLIETIGNESAFLGYSIFGTIFTTLLICVTWALRKRVAIVVQLFREAGAALTTMPGLALQPLVTYSVLTVFFCCWLYVLLCLATADLPTADRQPTTEKLEGAADLGTGLRIIKYNDPTWVKYMWWIHLIGLIWCSEFILGCQQMVIAMAVSVWYFSRDRTSLRFIMVEATCRLVKHHLGSIALGSFLITLVKIPRLILMFTDKMVPPFVIYSVQQFGEKWTIIKWLKRGCICCLACFERFLQYVHHNAYSVIAIQGINFCPASRLALNTLVLNALQVGIINSVGDFILFLAKCLTAVLTGLVALMMFKSDETLYFYAIPVLLTVVFSYFVAHCVISVFEMAVDTLFLCFCEDHNMNDGTDGKPYYAPPSLYKYMTQDALNAVSKISRATVQNRKPKEVEMTPMNKGEAVPMNPPASSVPYPVDAPVLAANLPHVMPPELPQPQVPASDLPSAPILPPDLPSI